VAAIAVLGPLSVDGEANALAPRERAVLATLVVRRGDTVSAEVLADALWGDQPPASWAKMLQNCIVRLRKLLGVGAIETRQRGYCLVVPADEIDACRFEAAVTRAQELLRLGEPDRAAYLVDEAVRLWHGAPLADLDGWEAGAVEARRLSELRLDAEELRVDAHLRAGRFREVLAEAQARVAEAPTRERRWALLATAQYQAGRQADALRTVRRARTVLLEELGLDPGPDLADLEGAILRQDPSLVATTALPDASAACPYPGLPSYDVDDADAYFGRDADVSACLRRLADTGVLAVVGPSGSGKSSLVRAGVAAALERDGRRVVVVTPGARPLDALARLPPSGLRPVLVVDQCEEAVTLCRDAGEQSRFFAALADHAAGAPLVVALRADRLGELSTHPDMAHLVERGLHLLQRLGEDDLRAAIEGPARQAGLLLEPGLVDLLVRDVEGEPGALPPLSHSLRETWLRREGRTLTVAGYRDAGGIRGAVAQSAEHLYEQAPPGRQALLRDLLLRLVAPSPEGEPVRARVPRRLVAGDPEHEQLIEQLVQARLVTSDEDAVELAHEALARAWPRLRGWLDDDVEGQRIWRHLALAADSWEGMGRPDSELYRGVRLTRVLDWAERVAPDLNPSERTFLDASRRVEDVRTRAVRRRRRSVVVGLAAGTVVALTLAAVAVTNQRRADREAGRAEVAAEEADRSARLARSRELAGAAINALDTDPGLSKLLAVTAAAEAAPTVESTAALHQAWAADPVIGRSRAVHDAGTWPDLDPTGRRLVTAGSYPVNATNGTLAVVDPRTDEHLWTVQLDEPSAFVGSPFFTEGGERVVAGVFWDPFNTRRMPGPLEDDAVDEPVADVLGAHVWDADTGELVERIELGRCGGLVTAMSETHLLVRTLRGPEDVLRACDWAAGTMSAELLDLGTGERELLAADTRVDLSGAAMSGDGRYVAFDDAAAGTVTVRNVASGDTVLQFSPTPGRERPGVRDLNRDGSLLLYGGDPIEVWDVAAGEVITSFDRQEGASRSARFDPSGRAVVSTDAGGNVRRWDAATGEQLFALAAVGNGRASMTADGLILASDIDSNAAVLVDTGLRGEAGAVETCDGQPHPDSLQIVGELAAFHVTCGGDTTGTTHVVDVASGELVRALPGHQGRALGCRRTAPASCARRAMGPSLARWSCATSAPARSSSRWPARRRPRPSGCAGRPTRR
jgi:DNA-binding SARP family transcriptional activator